MNWICTNNLNCAETCLINDARSKVMGFGAGKTMPKTSIGARLYPSYRNPGYACLVRPHLPYLNTVVRYHPFVMI
ncbi:MAG: hypothetical protein GY862_32985 [Gammaproteobacteria bacterium]|nr:hypothetical protein [Gammaproteobacteria bacterium]